MSEKLRTTIAVHASARAPFLTALPCALFLACGVLLLAIQDGLPRRSQLTLYQPPRRSQLTLYQPPLRSQLTLYQPPSLRFPGWVMRSQPKKKKEATKMQVRELSTEINVVNVDYVEYVRADV